MMMPNIEALTLGELQYIAQKQGLERSEEMDRESLLEALVELFEERGLEHFLHADPGTGINQPRFSNAIFGPTHADYDSLPGVTELPERYSQTALHLILKNPYWGHLYWDINPADVQVYEQGEEEYSYVLRVEMSTSSSLAEDGEIYDITISRDDSSWNINLPIPGRSYRVSLVVITETGSEEVLCASNLITSPKCGWAERAEELNQDPKLFYLLFSSLVSKGSSVLNCTLVQEVIATMNDLRRNAL